MPILLGLICSGVMFAGFQSSRQQKPTIIPPVHTTEVSMETNRFLPNHIEVPAGATVVWTNNDPWRHNVVFQRGVLPGSAYLEMSETYTTTFRTTGTYDYVCSLHAGMIARVTVVRITD